MGGTLNLGDQPPHKELMTEFCQTLVREVKDLDIEVKLNTEANPADLKSEDYYGIVVAIGGQPMVPPIEGIDSDNVHLFDAVLRHQVELKDKNIIVLGGGETGLETAELLADQGNKVTVVEMLGEVGQDMYPSVIGMMKKRFGEKGVDIITNYKVVKMDSDEVLIRSTITEQDKTMAADTLVIASGVRPDKTLISQFKEANDQVIVIGDAYKPGNIAKALKEANDKCFVF